jgi:hypothetical protein
MRDAQMLLQYMLWKKLFLPSIKILIKHIKSADMVEHTCNSSIPEAEAGWFQVQGQPGLYRELKNSLGHIVRLYIKKKNTQNLKTVAKIVSWLYFKYVFQHVFNH